MTDATPPTDDGIESIVEIVSEANTGLLLLMVAVGIAIGVTVYFYYESQRENTNNA